MTAREAIHRLNERGWSNSQIAAAMGRGRGQIINISSGRAPGKVLQGPLEALTKRKAPPPGKLPPAARGEAKPPPKRPTTGGRGIVADRTTVGKGKTRRNISESLPGHDSAKDIRRELLAYSNRRVNLTLVAKVNGRRVLLRPFPKGIKGRSLRQFIGDLDDLIEWLIEHHYLDPVSSVEPTGWLIEEAR